MPPTCVSFTMETEAWQVSGLSLVTQIMSWKMGTPSPTSRLQFNALSSKPWRLSTIRQQSIRHLIPTLWQVVGGWCRKETNGPCLLGVKYGEEILWGDRHLENNVLCALIEVCRQYPWHVEVTALLAWCPWWLAWSERWIANPSSSLCFWVPELGASAYQGDWTGEAVHPDSPRELPFSFTFPIFGLVNTFRLCSPRGMGTQNQKVSSLANSQEDSAAWATSPVLAKCDGFLIRWVTRVISGVCCPQGEITGEWTPHPSSVLP